MPLGNNFAFRFAIFWRMRLQYVCLYSTKSSLIFIEDKTHYVVRGADTPPIPEPVPPAPPPVEKLVLDPELIPGTPFESANSWLVN